MGGKQTVAVGRPGATPSLLRLLERLADIGSQPEDTRDERLRAGALILASVLISLLSFLWVAAYLAYGRPLSAAIPATYQVVTVVGLACGPW